MTCPFLFVIIFRRKTSVRGTRTARWERGIIMIQCARACTAQEFVALNLSSHMQSVKACICFVSRETFL